MGHGLISPNVLDSPFNSPVQHGLVTPPWSLSDFLFIAPFLSHRMLSSTLWTSSGTVKVLASV